MTSYRTILDVAIALGAELGETHTANTRSDYTVLYYAGRSVELRGSDHFNNPNPTTANTARSAYTLRPTARGFERALALWLGYSPRQLRGLNLTTQRDLAKLAALTPEDTEL